MPTRLDMPPVVSVSFTDKLLSELDDLIDKRGYGSRSEAIRDAVTDFLGELEVDTADMNKFLEVFLVVTYPSEKRGVENRLTNIRHEHDELVPEAIHRHVGQICLELLQCQGRTNEVVELVGKIRAVRGVEQVKMVAIPLEKPERY